jgi:hypothetical protein
MLAPVVNFPPDEPCQQKSIESKNLEVGQLSKTEIFAEKFTFKAKLAAVLASQLCEMTSRFLLSISASDYFSPIQKEQTSRYRKGTRDALTCC